MKWHVIETNPLFMTPYKCAATYKTEAEATADLAKRNQRGLDQYVLMDSTRWSKQWYVAHLTPRGRSRRRNRLAKLLGGTPKFTQA